MDGEVGGKTVPTAPSQPMSKGERPRNRLLEVAYQAVIRRTRPSTAMSGSGTPMA